MKKKTEPPPKKRNLIVIRGYDRWREWLERYAKFKGVPSVTLIDMLLREAARKDSFEAPPERY